MDIEFLAPWDEPKTPHNRKQRMEVLLREWYVPPRWRYYPHPHGQSPPRVALMLTDAERTAWQRLIEVAEVVPPMTAAAGVRFLIRLHNVVHPTKPWIESELVAAGDVKIVGNRGAISNSLLRSFADHDAYHWSSCAKIKQAGIDAAALNSAATKQSVDLVTVGDYTIIKAARRVDGTADGAFLLNAAARTADRAHVYRLWERASALHVSDFFLDGLSQQGKRLLAEHLEEHFSQCDKTQLHWKIDEDLYTTAGGTGRHFRPTRSPYPSRVGDLVEAASLFEHLHGGTANSYYADLIAALIECADFATIANVLSVLPAGDTLMHGLDCVANHRPTDLANMVWHPSWRADAAFAVSRMSAQKTIVSGLAPGNLIREWRAIQLDTRQIGCSDKDRLEVPFQLAIEDECALVAGRGRAALSVAEMMSPWAESMRDRDFAERTAAIVEAFVSHDSVNSETVRVALRLLQLADTQYPEIADRIAKSSLCAYTRAITNAAQRSTLFLARVGDIAAEFARVLRRGGDEMWTQFRTPLDAAAIASASEKDDQLRHVIIDHVNNLCAVALFGTASDVTDVVTEVLRLREQTIKADAANGGFGWWDLLTMHRPSDPEELLWLRLGRAMARFPVDSQKLVRDCVRQLGGLELAYLLWGVGAASPLATELRRHVLDLVGKEFENDRIMLDRALNAVEALYYSTLYAQAEDGARKVLKIIDERDGRARAFGTYYVAATRLLKAALVAQNKVEEALQLTIEPSSPDDIFILKNLDAAALLRTGQTQNGRNLLNQILQDRPADSMASTNLVYSYVAEKNWSEAVAAARRARETIQKNLPEQIAQLEALALWHLRRFDESAQVVRQLSASARTAPEMIQLRIDLMLMVSPDYRALNEDLDVLAKDDPVLAGELKTRLAPAVEADASGLVYHDLAPARISFEERIARASHQSPTDRLLVLFQLACRSITEHPTILEALDNEDYITQLIAWHLEAELKKYGADAKTNVRGGAGRKQTGVADLLIFETSLDSHHRPLVRGEAKYWDGTETLLQNLNQVFGTANTGSELFVVALIYSRNRDFGAVLKATKEAIRQFSVDVDGQVAYRCVGGVEDVADHALCGDRVRVLKSIHELRYAETVSHRTVYTFVLDTVSRDARIARGGEDVDST